MCQPSSVSIEMTDTKLDGLPLRAKTLGGQSYPWVEPLKLKGTTAMTLTRKRPSKSILNAYKVNRASEKVEAVYEKMQSLMHEHKLCILLTDRLNTVLMAFFTLPITCLSVALHGGPATSM
nr:2200_t:CDS:2 [Entrophospora candida]